MYLDIRGLVRISRPRSLPVYSGLRVQELLYRQGLISLMFLRMRAMINSEGINDLFVN